MKLFGSFIVVFKHFKCQSIGVRSRWHTLPDGLFQSRVNINGVPVCLYTRYRSNFSEPSVYSARKLRKKMNWVRPTRWIRLVDVFVVAVQMPTQPKIWYSTGVPMPLPSRSTPTSDYPSMTSLMWRTTSARRISTALVCKLSRTCTVLFIEYVIIYDIVEVISYSRPNNGIFLQSWFLHVLAIIVYYQFGKGFYYLLRLTVQHRSLIGDC